MHDGWNEQKKQQLVFLQAAEYDRIIFGNRKTKEILPDVPDILASAVELHDGVVFPRYRGTQTDTKSNKPRRTAIIQNRRYRESVRQ